MLVTSVANIILFGGKGMKLVELNAHNLNNEFIARLAKDYEEMAESMGELLNDSNKALTFISLADLVTFGDSILAELAQKIAKYSQMASQKEPLKSTDKLVISVLRNSFMGEVSVIPQKTDTDNTTEVDYSAYYNSVGLAEFEDYIFYPNDLQEALTGLDIDVTINIEQVEPLTLVEEVKQSWSEHSKPVVEEVPEEPQEFNFDDSLESKQQLIYEDYKEGVPAKTLATIYGVSVGYVYTVINRHKSPDAPRKGVALKVAHILDDTTKVNQVIADYTSGKSIEELYAEYELHKNGLYYILDLYDVPRRGRVKRKGGNYKRRRS